MDSLRVNSVSTSSVEVGLTLSIRCGPNGIGLIGIQCFLLVFLDFIQQNLHNAHLQKDLNCWTSNYKTTEFASTAFDRSDAGKFPREQPLIQYFHAIVLTSIRWFLLSLNPTPFRHAM